MTISILDAGYISESKKVPRSGRGRKGAFHWCWCWFDLATACNNSEVMYYMNAMNDSWHDGQTNVIARDLWANTWHL